MLIMTFLFCQEKRGNELAYYPLISILNRLCKKVTKNGRVADSVLSVIIPQKLVLVSLGSVPPLHFISE